MLRLQLIHKVCPAISKIAPPNIRPFCCQFAFLCALFGSLTTATAAGPVLEIAVTPAAPGKQLVRTSLPFGRGTLYKGQELEADDGTQRVPVAVRPLGYHVKNGEPKSIRIALVTFPYQFTDDRAVTFQIRTTAQSPAATANRAVDVQFADGDWKIRYENGTKFVAKPVWPHIPTSTAWTPETVEDNDYYRWQRWVQGSDQSRREVEFRYDHLGQVIAVAHYLHKDKDRHWAPDFGWELIENLPEEERDVQASLSTEKTRRWKMRHSFAPGLPFEYLTGRRRYRVTHPAALFKLRGSVFTRDLDDGSVAYRYYRSTTSDHVPMQPFSWRRAELVLSPVAASPISPVLQTTHQLQVDWQAWNDCYQSGEPLAVQQPLLQELLDYHRQAVLDSVMFGHDWGNLSAHQHGQSRGGIFGMNRLNHAPAFLLTSLRQNDTELCDAALAWCNNFCDLTVFWGPSKPGGTRYPSRRLSDNPTPQNDTTFSWRGKRSKDFCTKGYDTFLLAYEQTGDPRMLDSLKAQVAYASEKVHAQHDKGESRNIGDVADFVRLYELTGEEFYLDNALRLFRELRTVLSDDLLFDQKGNPIVKRPAFIDEDEVGKQNPFPKPYIIGYALAGCPRLASHAPDEPLLKDMVDAVADFLAESQDPIGGWRYPHPRSSRLLLSQPMEHAWQLVQAAQLLGPKDAYLDAIERVLRQRLWIWKQTGKIAGMVEGWEISTGHIRHSLEIYDLYDYPEDRDSSRDYLEGRILLGNCPPEGIVYLPEVLRYYLQHRSEERLLEPPLPDSPLGQVLARLEQVN